MGTAYENGKAVWPQGLQRSSQRRYFQITADIEFGTADEAVGTVIAMSFYRSGAPVGWVTLPSTTIGDGDTFTVNADSLMVNGSSTLGDPLTALVLSRPISEARAVGSRLFGMGG